MEKVILPDSPSFVDLCTLHQHAMRYYRLWIYACNIVLAVATLVFTVFAVSVLVDPRLKLLSGVEFYQPTFLYAYVALLLQCGVLQAIGCLGALRLNQKLLNTYWTLLLVLMIGDIIVGLVWAFRLDRIKSTLRPSLRQRLASQYRVDPDFTEVWDWIQSHDMCCGVDSPLDYPLFNESFTRNYDQNRNIFHEFVVPLLPATCCTITPWDSNPRDSDSEGDDAVGAVPGHHTNNYGSIFPHFVKTSTGHHRGGGGSASGSGSSREQLHRHQHHTRTKPQSSSSEEQQQPQQPYVGRRKNPAIAAAKKQSGFNSMEFVSWDSAAAVRLLHSDDFNHNHNPNARIPLSQSSSAAAVPVPAAVKQMTTTASTTTTTTESGTSSRNNRNNNLLNSICVLPPELISKLKQDENNNLLSSTLSSTEANVNANASHFYHVHQHHIGCGDKMMEWIDHVTDMLFVIGFCIIVFLKGCFLAILRYEIKEMIQKIRLLNGDEAVRTAAMNELMGLTGIYGTEESHDDAEEGGAGGGTDGQGLMSSGAGGGGAGRGGRASIGGQGRDSGSGGPRESTSTSRTTASATTTTVMLSSNENTASGSSSNSNGGKGDVGIGGKPFIENHIGNKPASATRKKSSSAMIIEEDFDSARALLEQLTVDNTYSKSKLNFSSGSAGAPRSAVIPIPPRNGNNNIHGLQMQHSIPMVTATPPPPPPPQRQHQQLSHIHQHTSQDSSSTPPIPMVNFNNRSKPRHVEQLPPTTTTTTAIE